MYMYVKYLHPPTYTYLCVCVLHGCVCVYVCTMMYMYQPYISTCIFLPEQMRDKMYNHDSEFVIQYNNNYHYYFLFFNRYLGYWLYICGTIDV